MNNMISCYRITFHVHSTQSSLNLKENKSSYSNVKRNSSSELGRCWKLAYSISVNMMPVCVGKPREMTSTYYTGNTTTLFQVLVSVYLVVGNDVRSFNSVIKKMRRQCLTISMPISHPLCVILQCIML